MSRPRFRKAYLEITNRCNLSCSFCPGTVREPRIMTAGEFRTLAERLRPCTDYLYLHLMGEPLSHPELEKLLSIGTELGFHLMITTNGTLLPRQGHLLLESPGVDKVSISLHSFEANSGTDPEVYLTHCLKFAREAGLAGKKCALRLWNLDGATTQGEHALNDAILARLHAFFPGEWREGRQGVTLEKNVYLEWGEKFEWPDLGLEQSDTPLFCHGLRDQIGVLADGTVVPCCLDHNGEIPLGNLFRQSMEEILAADRAQTIYNGFSARCAVEPLCRTCGYARRF